MPRDTQQPEYAGPRQPWTRPSFVAAAVLMLFVVLVGVGVALSSRDGDTTPTQSAPTGTDSTVDGPGPTLTGSAGAGQDIGDGPGGGSLPAEVPTVAPDGVRWQLFGQIAVPTSATAGPARDSATTASGFARTPTGALIGAAHLAVRSGFSSGRPAWEPTITQQFVPSADRDRLLAAMRAEPPQAAQPGELAQIAGFLYQSYSSDTAVIGLVLRAPGAANTYATLSLTLQWRDGDWKMVAPPGGTWRSLTRQSTDLVGVVEWGAV